MSGARLQGDCAEVFMLCASRSAQSRRPEFVIPDLLLRHPRQANKKVASFRRNAGEQPKWPQ